MMVGIGERKRWRAREKEREGKWRERGGKWREFPLGREREEMEGGIKERWRRWRLMLIDAHKTRCLFEGHNEWPPSLNPLKNWHP